MPFIEQVLFGVDHKAETPGRSVLGHSPGMGREVTKEIVRLCENWGTAPALGLEHPALMSFRLDENMPSLAGNLFTVIRAGRGLNPLFHAVVLSETAFVEFQRNPFAVAGAMTFIDEWNPAVELRREEIHFVSTFPLVDPPADKSDIGLVDEAVLKFIAEGKLTLPIEQANARSDRCLALIIACLPEKHRRNLRFASFAPANTNNYTLVGLQTEGCAFAGWQRMMMAWLAGDYVEEVDSYIGKIRDYLEAGDLAGISRTSQRHMIQPGSSPEPFENVRRGTISTAIPARESRPDAGTGTARPSARPTRPVQRSVATPMSGTAAAGWGTGGKKRSKPRRISALKRNSPGSLTGLRGGVNPRSKFLRVGLLVVLLAVAGTAGLMWKEGKTLAESLEWANLQGIMGEDSRTERAATLLEVVDVGDVYARQLKLVSQAGKGLNPSLDKGRNKAIGNLREEAAVPLNQQVELFAKLAADGIQQGRRPDRESQRMKSLAGQGLVLKNELARLELAWYSLASGVFWRDLPSLPDEAVIARCDSLAKVEKDVLDDARRDLGIGQSELVLERTRGHVDGMASLLILFEAKSWSPAWQRNLSRAARSVSTTTSHMTRAYANSAFALLRLKRAERKGNQTSLPYCRELTDQAWPSAEIRSILINLRAQTAMFPDGQAPSLLTGTLKLYLALKEPATLVVRAAESPAILGDLTNNRAVRFDPEAYGDFLERIRYEAALRNLDWSDDPDLIPDSLYAARDREQVIGFRNRASIQHAPEEWEAQAAAVDIPFLARWATHLGALARVDLERARQEFDAAWVECRKTAVKLQDEAAAGRDWTATWVSLDGQVRGILAMNTGTLALDQERAVKMSDVTNLSLALQAPLPLGLQAGTIRLDQDRMLEAGRAVMEFRVVPGQTVWRSDEFLIGPAAPQGTGWVGTVTLGQTLDILPNQGLDIRIIAEKRDEILLEVTCPPLAEGVGPGGLVRPRSGGRGSVSLKIDKDYWKSLRVPDLGTIF